MHQWGTFIHRLHLELQQQLHTYSLCLWIIQSELKVIELIVQIGLLGFIVVPIYFSLIPYMNLVHSDTHQIPWHSQCIILWTYRKKDYFVPIEQSGILAWRNILYSHLPTILVYPLSWLLLKGKYVHVSHQQCVLVYSFLSFLVLCWLCKLYIAIVKAMYNYPISDHEPFSTVEVCGKLKLEGKV